MIKIKYIEPHKEEQVAKDVFEYIKNKYKVKLCVAVNKGSNGNHFEIKWCGGFMKMLGAEEELKDIMNSELQKPQLYTFDEVRAIVILALKKYNNKWFIMTLNGGQAIFNYVVHW